VHVTREAQLDARERSIKEQQRSAVEAENRNEKKVAELRGLLESLQEIQRGMRSESFADKERLANEAERLRAQAAARDKLNESREAAFAEERKALNEVRWAMMIFSSWRVIVADF
jgi:phage-related tail protein